MRWYLGPRNAVILLLIIAIVFYFAILPSFWKAPTAMLECPSTAIHNQDARIAVTISSMHSNVDLVHAHLVIEYPNYRQLKLPASLYPITLFETTSVKEYWTWINRLTWPHNSRYEFTLPLGNLAEKGLAKPGVLQGTMYLVVNCPQVVRYRRLYTSGYHSRPTTLTMPFKLTLSE